MANILHNIKTTVENWLPRAVERDKEDNWWFWVYMNEFGRRFYGDNKVDLLCESNAYLLACTLSEIFFPIDAIADRVSSLRFEIIETKTGKIATNVPANVQRLIEQPNPFTSFSGLVYESVFNELADGNNWLYIKSPKSIKGLSPDTISSIWCLQPDKVDVKIKNIRPSIFDTTSITDIIDQIIYTKYDREEIDPRRIIHERNLTTGSYGDGFKSRSPLMAATRNINNLLAVYQARYKIYVNNGSAGILTRKALSNSSDMQDIIDPITRDKIIDDILDRNGLIGDKKPWSVSAIPLEFIKTLATISEIQPFEEAREDALQVAGIYGVDKDLLPFKEGTTFSNKETAEKNLYQNVVKGVANDKASTLTKAYAINQIGLEFRPSYDEVEVLQKDIETSLSADNMLIANLIELQAIGQIDDSEMKEICSKIINKYKNG